MLDVVAPVLTAPIVAGQVSDLKAPAFPAAITKFFAVHYSLCYLYPVIFTHSL
jgi:hypothetical protein